MPPKPIFARVFDNDGNAELPGEFNESAYVCNEALACGELLLAELSVACDTVWSTGDGDPQAPDSSCPHPRTDALENNGRGNIATF